MFGMAAGLVKNQVKKKAQQKVEDKKKKKGEGTTSNNSADKNNTGRKQNMKGASAPKDVAPDIAQANKRMPGTAVEQVAHDVGPVRDNPVDLEPVDTTLNQMANMPEGTDVQGAIGKGTPELQKMVGGQAKETIGQTMVPQERDQTPVNADTNGDIPADLQAEVPDVGDERSWLKKKWDETPVEEQVAPDMTPVDQTTFEGAGEEPYQAPRRGVIEGMDLPGKEQLPIGDLPKVQDDEVRDQGVTPIDAGSEARADFERKTTPEDIKRAQEAGVDRPSYWKVALSSLLGGMPLIPGSSLANEPLRRAREDWAMQTNKDKELTDIFLKEMGSGDWKGAQQLAKTGMFRDAVTRTMKMTPDDLMNLDKAIQENSAYTLSDAIDLAKKAKDAGLEGTPGKFKADIPHLGTMEVRQPKFEMRDGLFYRTDPETGDLVIAKDKEKEVQDARIKALMDEGMTYSEAVLAEERVGKGVPRYKVTKLENGVVVSHDQFSGNVVKYKISDAVKSNTAMEIFKDMSGVPIGYFMYDKNKPVPTDMTKVTPVFFKNVLWGDQSKGRYTWYDAMKGRQQAIDKQEGGFLSWISKNFMGLDVTDNTPDMPQGDESEDYATGTYKEVNANPSQQQQQQQTGTTNVPPPAPAKRGSTAKATVGPDADEKGKADKFLDITG